MLLAFFDGPEKCRLTVPDEAGPAGRWSGAGPGCRLGLRHARFAGRAVNSAAVKRWRHNGQEQEQLRKKVNAMAKVLDLSRPLIAMLSALPFKAAEHAMNCFQIEERAPCVSWLSHSGRRQALGGAERARGVRTLNLSGDVKRTVGILHKWENERGFGFIHDENDTSDPPLDIFVHRTNLMGCAPGYPVDLQEGRRICYIPGFQDGRTRAMSAAMIDEDFNVDPVHLRRPRKAKAAEQSKDWRERKIAKLKEAIEREEHPLSKSFMQFLATAEMQEVIQEKRQEGEAWLRCLGLLRQPPGGKRDDILWRKEIDRRVDIFLDLKTSPLTKKDIDYRCKRILTEFCMRSSAVRVSEALAMVEKSTSGKRREEVRSWPAYVATLLRRFDPEMTAQMEKKPKAEPKKEKETNESPGREEDSPCAQPMWAVR
ncbi:unnamed protein product [Durusdinium trenchii]|uniref:CSD domain-containing protein n=1 Tax=Durusdinium trenchii TaxID=1381693 RepID=A0ABP0QQK1_9DINO